MGSFFNPGTADCAIYRRVRDKNDEPNTKGREFIERMWHECGQFLDPAALTRARQSMPSVFWELYVAHTLRGAGLSLQSLNRTRQNQAGPDLFTRDPDVWIEAVQPTPGTKNDALENPPFLSAYGFPEEQFLMRLTGVFKCKAKKLEEYARAGLVGREQAQVVAISGCLLPGAPNEGPLPRIVQAILGVGHLVLQVDLSRGETVGISAEQRDEVRKKNGEPVSTASFLDSANRHISAVIYSASGWVSRPKVPGSDFAVVHNPNADVRLPRGWLTIGDEYWREADTLCSARNY